MDFIPAAFIDFTSASFLSNPNKEFYTQILYTNIILAMFSKKILQFEEIFNVNVKKTFLL